MSVSPYLLGLTGSIGMGKSTTARMFADEGIPVWDADEAVSQLYAAGADGAVEIAGLVPDAVSEFGVEREILRAAILEDPALLGKIEARIHPLLAKQRAGFLSRHSAERMLLFDIPLLYETNAEDWLSGVLVVTAPEDVQRARVLARSEMTEQMFEKIRARQTPESEKIARADFVIRTDNGLEAARESVRALITELTNQVNNA